MKSITAKRNRKKNSMVRFYFLGCHINSHHFLGCHNNNPPLLLLNNIIDCLNYLFTDIYVYRTVKTCTLLMGLMNNGRDIFYVAMETWSFYFISG